MKPAFRSLSINLPPEIMSQMNLTMERVFNYIVETSVEKVHGNFVWKRTRYTEEYLSKRLLRSREWVSKMIRRLEEMNLIEVVRKRYKGRFCVNEYRLSKWVLSLLGKWKQTIYTVIDHVKSNIQRVGYKPIYAYINLSNSINNKGPTHIKDTLSSVMKDILSKKPDNEREKKDKEKDISYLLAKAEEWEKEQKKREEIDQAENVEIDMNDPIIERFMNDPVYADMITKISKQNNRELKQSLFSLLKKLR